MRQDELLFITQYYAPELVGSAPFCADVAEWFAEERWKTTVLTGLPNYPDGSVFAAYREGARRRERIHGVSIERLPIWVPKKRTAFARIASEMWFFLLGSWALLSRRIKRSRLVVSLSPSILVVLLGRMARLPRGRHVTFVHDIQSGLAHGLQMVKAPWLLRLMRYCERRILNRVDLIVVLTEEMKEYLRESGVTAAIEVVPIWADTDRIEPVGEIPSAAPRLVYSGSFGRKQKVEQIIEIASELQERAPKMELLLRGRGKEFETLRAVTDGLGLRNMRFADLVAAEDLFAGMSLADIHVVMHDPSAARFAIPSKIYNILAGGLPCIAQAEPGTALWRLYQKSRGFLCIAPGDTRASTDAVLRLAEDAALRRDLGQNGRRYILKNGAKRSVLDRLFEAIGDFSHGSEKRSVLIFEPEPEGHSEEWLRHLIGYVREHDHRSIVWIVVAPELFGSLAVELRGDAGDLIRLLPLRKIEAKLCRHRWLIVSSLARWRTARRYAARTRAKAVHFLSIDLLALPLALRFPWGDRSVSGVLFRPSTHYRLLGRYEPTASERLRDLRKEFLYRLMLSRSSLRRVLTIDPYFEAFAGRFYRQGAKVRSVADPADRTRAVSIDSARLAAKFPRERVLFLFFGHLTERKGTLVLLDALRLLPADVASRAAVMLVGKVDPSIDDAVRMKMEALHAARPALLCHLENRRVEYAEIEALTRRANVVLAPYQRFVGSSGVLLWAARLGKPLLTQDFGVLGSLVREYGLGLAVDCTKRFLLADAMTRLVIDGPGKFVDLDGAQEFIVEHTPDNFSRAILASLAA